MIIPSFRFVATAHALQWQGITPVFADINPATHNLDVKSVERLITPRTTGIVGVHIRGRACDTTALAKLAQTHRLKLMYDAAYAFGCTHDYRLIGGFRECEVYSFHATKFLNSFEGGAVVTNDDVLAQKMHLMRKLGFLGYDNVVHSAVNRQDHGSLRRHGPPTSLESLAEFVALNRRN